MQDKFRESEMKTVIRKGIKGSRGSWEAEVPYTDGTKERLPCVHKHYRRTGPAGFCYHEPRENFGDSVKREKHIGLIREKECVVLTEDSVDESKHPALIKRKGYVGVFSIVDFVFDDVNGMRFRFVDRFPER
jgi:hypothetical protein